MIVYRQTRPRLGGHERLSPAAPKANGRPSAIGHRIVAHVQADTDRRRAERNERLAQIMAQRLAEIQNAEAQRQRKGKR